MRFLVSERSTKDTTIYKYMMIIKSQIKSNYSQCWFNSLKKQIASSHQKEHVVSCDSDLPIDLPVWVQAVHALRHRVGTGQSKSHGDAAAWFRSRWPVEVEHQILLSSFESPAVEVSSQKININIINVVLNRWPKRKWRGKQWKTHTDIQYLDLLKTSGTFIKKQCWFIWDVGSKQIESKPPLRGHCTRARQKSNSKSNNSTETERPGIG